MITSGLTIEDSDYAVMHRRIIQFVLEYPFIKLAVICAGTFLRFPASYSLSKSCDLSSPFPQLSCPQYGVENFVQPLNGPDLRWPLLGLSRRLKRGVRRQWILPGTRCPHTLVFRSKAEELTYATIH